MKQEKNQEGGRRKYPRKKEGCTVTNPAEKSSNLNMGKRSVELATRTPQTPNQEQFRVEGKGNQRV